MTARALLIAFLTLVACESTPPLEWEEMRCFGELCFGRLGDGWVRIVSASTLSEESPSLDAPACTPVPGFSEVRCIAAAGETRCFAGDGEWFAPFSCDTEVGELAWPSSICDGSAGITAGPWDDVGCSDEACHASIGEATFVVWPDCHMQSL